MVDEIREVQKGEEIMKALWSLMYRNDFVRRRCPRLRETRLSLLSTG
jgi:hypothetical protein